MAIEITQFPRARSDFEIAEEIIGAVQAGRAAGKKTVVVLTGAGVSQESGVPTFRDHNGLWENHAIEDVATPRGWRKNPELVLRFYNERRRAAAAVLPNEGHLALKRLEEKYTVVVVTQNVDALHERAGSSLILHLHGELTKVRSETRPDLIYEIGAESIETDDVCETGGRLRPHIVWFEEDVPMISYAAALAEAADYFLVVGTSLLVYPAAGLIDYVPAAAPKYIIDKHRPSISGGYKNLSFVIEPATTGVPRVADILLALD